MVPSILILTFNEEIDLEGCIDSCMFSDDIVVVDSNSTDSTKEIALKNNARWIIRPNYNSNLPFGGDESLHRNWAIHNIDFKNKYLFILDADERISSELAVTLTKLEVLDQEKNAFKVKRYDYLGKSRLNYVQASSWYTRLIIPSKCYYTRLINPVLEVYGNEVGALKGCINHFPFSKGWERWFDKHNNYSTLEASEYLKMNKILSFKKLKSALFSKNFNVRSSYFKRIFYLMPCRPLVKFIYLYLFKFGFLDGKAGFTYATLQSIYEYMIVIKADTLKSIEK